MIFQVDTGSVGQRTLRGLVWLFGARVFSQLASLLITTILARLLTPSDYGLIGMATVITGFLTLFVDFGTGMAIVQQERLAKEQLSSIFWLNIAIGLVLSLIVVAVSPLAARFYGEPALISLVSVIAIGFPLTSLGVVQGSLFRRKLQFDTLVKINLVAVVLAGLAGVGAAVAGWGVWALVAQFLAQSLINTCLLWSVSPWRPRLLFARQDLRQIASFSTNLVGFNVINYFARNADNLLIGRVLGAGPLGLYALAYRLMLYPISNLSGVVGQALFPAFSRLQSENERLSHAYLMSCRYIALVTFPLMAGMSLMAREVILVVYGSRWEEATVALQFLALVGTFQPMVSLYGSVILAQGFANWFFRWSVVISAVMVTSFAIGLRWGIVGVAGCYLAAQVLVTVIGLPILFRKGGTPFSGFLAVLRVPVTAFMSITALLVRYILRKQTVTSDLTVLLVCVISGVLSYGIVLWLQGESFRTTVRSDIKMVLSLG